MYSQLARVETLVDLGLIYLDGRHFESIFTERVAGRDVDVAVKLRVPDTLLT